MSQEPMGWRHGWLSPGNVLRDDQLTSTSVPAWSLVRIPGTLETERLILRQPGVAEAAVHRQLWTERDQRVPPHRRIDVEGRPTAEDVAAQIRAESEGRGAGLLAVERKSVFDVIGYCGLTAHGNGSLEEPELAYELLRAAQG